MKQVLIILIPVVLLGISMAGGFTRNPIKNDVQFAGVFELEDITPGPSKNVLQIQNLVPKPTATPSPAGTASTPIPTPQHTPTPTTGGTCTIDRGIACSNPPACPYYLVTCQNYTCVNVVNGPNVNNSGDPNAHGVLTCAEVNNLSYNEGFGRPPGIGWCNSSYLNPTGDITSCMGKPVIYLYPEKDTYVDVSLSIPGIITKSIPEYGVNGWQNVLAHPDGSLEYQGNTYNELFYESQVTKVTPPLNGIIIPKSELEPNLSAILLHLGLNNREKEEFIEYWVPQLINLKGSDILFSILDAHEKERVDKVHISPEPDSRIEFLVYFKPLDYLITINPLILPEYPPERKGFTAVEWGGTIDTR